MSNSAIPETTVSFRLAFAPFEELRAQMGPEFSQNVRELADDMAGEGKAAVRGDAWSFFATLFSADFHRALAEAFSGNTATCNAAELDMFSRGFPSRRETAPDGTAVMVWPEELKEVWDNGTLPDMLETCADFDAFLPHFEAAARLFGAISLDTFRKILDVYYDVNLPEIPDWLESRLGQISDVALCGDGIVFNRIFVDFDEYMAAAAPSSGGLVAPQRIPPAARSLAARHGLPRSPLFIPDDIADFLRWADPHWFGNSQTAREFDLIIRNTLLGEFPGEEEIADSESFLHDIAQLNALGLPVDGLMSTQVAPGDVPAFKNLMDLMAEWMHLWALGGYTRDSFEVAKETIDADWHTWKEARRHSRKKKGKRRRR